MGILPPVRGDMPENAVVEYKLITAEGDYASSEAAYYELEEKVSQYLKNGWTLQGGVSVGCIGQFTFCICQAMVKYPERKTEEKEDLPDMPKIVI